jgi:hypothetical protein
MGIVIDAIRKGTPESLPVYGDSVAILHDGTAVFENPFSYSTEPNAVGPAGTAHAGMLWTQFEGRLKEGCYQGKVIDNRGFKAFHDFHHEIFVLLAGGNPVPTVNPNYTHKDEPLPDLGIYYARMVCIHDGYSEDCRGSLACQVVRPLYKEAFWKYLPFGASVLYVLQSA